MHHLEGLPYGWWALCFCFVKQLEHFKSGAHFTWWRNWWSCNWLDWALIRLKMCPLEHTHWWLNDVIILAPVSISKLWSRRCRDLFGLPRTTSSLPVTWSLRTWRGTSWGGPEPSWWPGKDAAFVTWILVGEAWSKSPRDSWRMADELATRDMMNNVLTKVNSVEEAVKIAEKKFQDSLDSLEILDSSVNPVDFNKEVRKALIPSYVINLSGCKIHVVMRLACNNLDTRMWPTKCGWKWLKSGQAWKLVFDDDEIDNDDFFECQKCFSEG